MRYQEGYKNLRMWAYTSLDLYKVRKWLDSDIVHISQVFSVFYMVNVVWYSISLAWAASGSLSCVYSLFFGFGCTRTYKWGYVCLIISRLLFFSWFFLFIDPFSLYQHRWNISARNFFHTFREDHEIMNLRDLQKLEGVLSPAHLQVSCFPHFGSDYFYTPTIFAATYNLLFNFRRWNLPVL